MDILTLALARKMAGGGSGGGHPGTITANDISYNSSTNYSEGTVGNELKSLSNKNGLPDISGTEVVIFDDECEFEYYDNMYEYYYERAILEEEGQELTVVFDGTTYECVVFKNPENQGDPILYAGDYSLLAGDDSYQGEYPFVIMSHPEFQESFIVTQEEPASHTIRVSSVAGVEDGTILAVKNGEWELRSGSLLPELTERKTVIDGVVQFEDSGDGRYFAELQSDAIFVAGSEANVVWDGVEYSCVAFDLGGTIAIGSVSIVMEGIEGEYPFFIGHIDENTLMIETLDTAGTHTVSLSMDMPIANGKVLASNNGEWAIVDGGALPVVEEEYVHADMEFEFHHQDSHSYSFLSIDKFLYSPPNIGTNVTVGFDGDEYTCTAEYVPDDRYPNQGAIALGDESILYGNEGSYPFYITINKGSKLAIWSLDPEISTFLDLKYDAKPDDVIAVTRYGEWTASKQALLPATATDQYGVVYSDGEWTTQPYNPLPYYYDGKVMIDGTFDFKYSDRHSRFTARVNSTKQFSSYRGTYITVIWDGIRYEHDKTTNSDQFNLGTDLNTTTNYEPCESAYPYYIQYRFGTFDIKTTDPSPKHTITIIFSKTKTADDGSALAVQNGKWAVCAGGFGSLAPAITKDAPINPAVSFTDGAEGMPVKDLIIKLDVAQSGSGTPSPSNVRDITFYTGLDIINERQNVYDYLSAEILSGRINTLTGGAETNANYVYLNNYLPVEPDSNYYIQATKELSGSNDFVVIYYDADKKNIFVMGNDQDVIRVNQVGLQSSSFHTPKNSRYIRFTYKTSAYDDSSIIIKRQEKTSLNWGSLANNVCCGYLDVTNGVILSPMTYVKISDCNLDNCFNMDSEWKAYYKLPIPANTSITAEPPVSNMAVYSSDTSITSRFEFSNDSTEIIIFDTDGTLTQEEFLAKYADMDIVYAIHSHSARTYVGSTQVKTFLGENNFSTSNGSIQKLEYIADTKMELDARQGVFNSDGITIGGITLTETQLQALLALLS